MRQIHALGLAVVLALVGGLLSVGVILTRLQAQQVVPGAPFSNEVPDLKYIPIYPGSMIWSIFGNNNRPAHRALYYEAPASRPQVADWYAQAFSATGWMPVPDVETVVKNGDLYALNFQWTAPDNSLPWHLELEVALDWIDSTTTRVNLNYGRYPDTGENFPIYSGAADIDVTTTEKAGEGLYKDELRRTTIKTYVTSASPEEIADYYNSTLPEYGWEYSNTVDPGATGPILDDQAGDINSQPGLTFASRGHSLPNGKLSGPRLYITAQHLKDGRTRVQLQIVEIESNSHEGL